jgi:diguanylate cyclase (GGDEF)-like protein
VLYAVVGTYLMQLAFFYLGLNRKADIKLAYLAAILYDMFFVPLFVAYSGGFYSSLYLLYYLTVAAAAYLLTFWYAAAVTVAIAASYTLLVWSELTLATLLNFVMRMGFLGVFFLTIIYASDFLRKSERRLLKLFDTLNMRTSELEKSQAQLEMIYENSRTLASILDVDGVIREVMRILGTTLQYRHYAVIFVDRFGSFYYRARQSDEEPNFNLKAIPARHSELIRRVADMQEPIRIKDLRERNDYVALNEASRSVMLVPMTTHGNTLGVLLAEEQQTEYFKERDVELLSSVARSAAMALENAELHRRTEELTTIDALTETYNYRYFIQKFEEEKKRALRYDLPLSIIMVDIDWFKKLNDTYGHEVGNIVLKTLSDIIKSCIRDVDVFARYGGEEFVIILPQTGVREAERIGERIRSRVEAKVIDVGQSGRVKITVSVGVSSFPENGKSHEELVAVADQALYRAKGSGKNLVCSI